MTQFTYRALDRDGIVTRGVVTADSKEEAREQLTAQDLRLKKLGKKTAFTKSDKIPRRHLAHFVRQLAAFIDAGVPLAEALHLLQEESRSRKLREIITDISTQIDHGEDVATAFWYRSDVFPSYFITIIRSADASGNLSQALEFLGVYLDRDIDNRRRVTASLLYPCVVLFLLTIASFAIIVFIFPIIQSFLDALQAKPSSLGAIMLGLSNFLRAHWLGVFLVVIVLVIGLIIFFRSSTGRRPIYRLSLRTPIIRDLITCAALERIFRLASAMLKAGVPLPTVIALSADTTPNPYFREPLLDSLTSLSAGYDMATPLRQKKSGFPPSAVRLIQVGEEAGSLPREITHLATYYGKELDYQIIRFNSIMEPTLIVILGAFIAIVGISYITTFYGALTQISQIH